MPDLRPYQPFGIDFLARRNAMLADPMGSGKTCQAILAAEKTAGHSRVLIVAPVSALEVWQDELATWAPHRSQLVYRGTPKEREKLRAQIYLDDVERVITNYEMMSELTGKIDYHTLIFDEAHRLRNRKTQRYRNAKECVKRSSHLIMLTGTPTVRHPVDIVPPIQLVSGERSYWRIVQEYFDVHVGKYAWEIGDVKDPAAWQAFLADKVLRRDRDELLPGLPKCVTRNLHLEMTPKQRQIYDQIARELYYQQSDGMIRLVPGVLAQITRMRQLLVCPRVLGIDDDGAAITLAREIAADTADVDQALVVFTPFVKATPYIAQALKLGGLKPAVITGQTNRAEYNRNITAFQIGEIDAIVATVQISEGFSLNRARRILFLGCDWNASANEQAIARVHRPGVSGTVLAEYIVHAGTIEKHVMDVVGLKRWREKKAFSANGLYGGI